ncbi:hypothetical protein [Skermanella stibiiresistens]|uniref:hypothetical protein n=1 Tax=Skermanella stibiiresistens TaxID=913326 RepID=UPI001B3B9F8D|nr:hypothetical protein [Skermanella stibiiresistens]
MSSEERSIDFVVEKNVPADRCWDVALACAYNAVYQQRRADAVYAEENSAFSSETGGAQDPNFMEMLSAEDPEVIHLALQYVSLLNRKGLVGV